MRNSMFLYLMRRLAQVVPLVIVIIILNFALIHAAPGDPTDIFIGDMPVTEEFLAQVRREFGLDRPLHVQLLSYIANVLSLDLGYSIRWRQPVLDIILERVPATALLMGTSILIAYVVGVLLGVVAARRTHGFVDNIATLFAIAGYAMPVFWLGQLFLLVFALTLDWFPAQGMVSMRAPPEGWARVIDIAHHMVLPGIAFGSYIVALIFRLTRVKMQEALSQDYITTARAKGLRERTVIYRHALRNALLPVVTMMGLTLPTLLTGSVLTETVFAWPGLGRLLFEAIGARDYPVLLGMFVVVSAFVIFANLVTDLIYTVIDPRVVYK